MKITVWIVTLLSLALAGCGDIEWFPEYIRSTTTPDQFTFTAKTDVTINAPQVSNSITVSGISGGPAPMTISGDATSRYSLNSGTASATATSVNNGDTVTVQHTSSSKAGTTVSTTLTIGDISAVFSSTTAKIASFSVTKTGAVNSFVTSDPITLNCVTGSYAISVANGLYSVDGVSFTDVAQTVFLTNGQSFYLRNFLTGGSVTTAVIIGGISSSFQSIAQ
jgi:hypothetical protein